MNKKKPISAKRKWAQRFLKIAGNLAPVTTVRLLSKYVFKPQKRQLKPAHIECLRKATKFKFEAEAFRRPGKMVKLSCYQWGEGSKTILLVHGWDAKALDYYRMIPHLVEAGYKVIAFDGPGHGKSEGESSHMVDFKQVLYQMAKRMELPYAIIGHSMGGAAATFMLMDYDVRVPRLVTIAIPIVSMRYFQKMFSVMKVPMKMQKAFYEGYIQEIGEPIERYNLLDRTETIKADKVLMVYDENDRIVSEADTKAFLQSHPEIERFNAVDTGHYNIIRSKLVVERILEFLK
ncbi:MAG TPA: alpha/beta fold hydrolase [Chitinophagales bacterium]|nr:alpha/beta fold hydrolase [Chitinophagales bacterium]